LKRHLAVTSSGFFAHDVGLVRDGCFFAGLLLAQSDLDGHGENGVEDGDASRWNADVEEGVEVCLRALGEIRWVYANTHEREKTLRAVWDARIDRDNRRRQSQGSQPTFRAEQSRSDRSPYMNDKAPLSRPGTSNSQSGSLALVSAGGQARPYLAPLSVSFPRVTSGPTTAVTDDGSGSWSTYTPPTTSGSTSTVATRLSLSPISPPQHLAMNAMQPAIKGEDAFYGGPQELDPFSFSVHGAANAQHLAGPGSQWSPYSHHQSYLDAGGIFSSADVALGRVSDDACPHFGSDCQGYYH
jgi:hypothetical protein